MNFTEQIYNTIITTNTENCLEITRDGFLNNISHYTIFGLLGTFGSIITYFGNKLVKPTLFTGGTLLSLTGSYNLLSIAMKYSPYQNCILLYIIASVFGIIGGFNILKWYYLVNFLLGFSSGASVGYLLYELLLHKYCLGTVVLVDTMLWLSTGIPGILFGLYSLKKEQEINLLLTSVIGPGLVIYSGNVLLYNTYYFSSLFNVVNVCIYILLFISGFYIQKNRMRKTDIPDTKEKFIGYV